MPGVVVVDFIAVEAALTGVILSCVFGCVEVLSKTSALVMSRVAMRPWLSSIVVMVLSVVLTTALCVSFFA